MTANLTRVSAAAALVLALAGCATGREASTGQPGSQAPTGSAAPVTSAPASPTNSATGLPTLGPPSEPPRTPTDQLPTDLVVGTVTMGGSGPCYRIVTDDGQQYALYGDDGTTVSTGDVVRVKIAQLQLKINCGPGQPARIVTMEIVR